MVTRTRGKDCPGGVAQGAPRLVSLPLSLAMGALLTASASVGAVGLVDDFSVTQQIDTMVTTTHSSSTGNASILGGQRDIGVLVVANPRNQDSKLTVGPFVTQNAVDFSNDSSVIGEATIQWDGPDQDIALNPIGLGGVDLTDNGTADALQSAILFSDHTGRFTVEVYTSATQYSIVEMETFDVTGTEPLIATLTFETFQSPGLSGGNILSVSCGTDGCADFTNVGAFQVKLNTPPQIKALDFVFGEITTVMVNPDIVKEISVDGGLTWFDANDDTTAPSQTVGAGALYRITVKNPGSTVLTDVVVNDALLGVVDHPIGDLDPGEVVVLTSGQIPALSQPTRCAGPGAVTNIASVTGTSRSTGAPVSAEDPANLKCVTESITLKKEVSVDGGTTWHDANDAASAPMTALGGDALYRLTVTNNGTSDLANVVVNDATLGVLNHPVGNLAAGVTKTLTSGDIPALNQPGRCTEKGTLNNVATVNGQSVPTGNPVSATDPANVACAEQAIRLIKEVSIDGGATYYDANTSDTAPTTGLGGGALYRLTVTNIGDVALINVVVNDATLGLVDVPVGILLVGETRVLTSGEIPELMQPGRCQTPGDLVNVAQTSGQPVTGGTPVVSEDPAVLKCVTESIVLKKEVSVDGGLTYFDANEAASGPTAALGGGALYRLTVTNNGTSALTNVVVNDATLGLANVPVGDLAIGETRTLTSGEVPALDQPGRCAIAGSLLNVADVHATSVPTGNPVDDTDPAYVNCEGGEPCIEIVKEVTVDGGDTWFSSEDEVPVCDPSADCEVGYRFKVSNCGTLDLDEVTVTDDQLAYQEVIGQLPVGSDVVVPAAGILDVPGRCAVDDTDTSNSNGSRILSSNGNSNGWSYNGNSNGGSSNGNSNGGTPEDVEKCNTATATACAAGVACTTPTVTDSDEVCLTCGKEEEQGTEGCTPGYWKQDQHFWAWESPYVPGLVSPPATKFQTVFENAFGGKTLLQVLGLGGGGLNALGRHTVAALLNAAASPDVDYPYTVDEVIAAFNAAYPGTPDAISALKDDFEAANELGCPLGNEKPNDNGNGNGNSNGSRNGNGNSNGSRSWSSNSNGSYSSNGNSNGGSRW